MIIDYIIYVAIGVFVLFVLLGLAICNYSFEQFASTYQKHNEDTVSFSTPVSLMNDVCSFELKRRVNLVVTNEQFNESYNPRTNCLKLGTQLADKATISALAVTAHELGHAKQYSINAKKMNEFLKKRISSSITSKFSMPLFLLSIILFFIFPEYYIFSLIGLGASILIFIISLSIKLSTIKIEKEASNYALEFLEKYCDFSDYNLKLAKELLNDALRTYKAEFLRSVLKWTFLVR